MTRALKVKAAVPFPIGHDQTVVYYAFEESDALEVGQTVYLSDPEAKLEKPVSIDDIGNQRELGFYDMGVHQVVEAMQELLEGQGRSGVSQRQWQLLKEQVWQLQDLAETCKDLENVEEGSDRWWYRIDGETGGVVLFQLSGEERELRVGGEFSNDEEKNVFAKRIANLINLSQEAQQCLKARSMAQTLFQSVKNRVADRSQSNPAPTTE